MHVRTFLSIFKKRAVDPEYGLPRGSSLFSTPCAEKFAGEPGHFDPPVTVDGMLTLITSASGQNPDLSTRPTTSRTTFFACIKTLRGLAGIVELVTLVLHLQGERDPLGPLV